MNVTCHFPCKLAVFFCHHLFDIRKLQTILSSIPIHHTRVHWQHTMMHPAVYASLQRTNQLLYSIQRCDYQIHQRTQHTPMHPAYTNTPSIQRTIRVSGYSEQQTGSVFWEPAHGLLTVYGEIGESTRSTLINYHSLTSAGVQQMCTAT